MKRLTFSLLLAVLAALPVLAQDPGLPTPPPAAGFVGIKVVHAQKGVIRADREDDPVETPVTIELPGRAPLAVSGPLTRLLRKRARNHEVVVDAYLLGGEAQPFGVFVSAIRGTATHDLPIYAPGDDVGHDQPLGTLPRGATCWVTGGNVYVAQHSDGAYPAGNVQVGRLAFGERVIAPEDLRELSGLLTADREDDPAEKAPQITVDGKTHTIVGPLASLLRKRARNRIVTLRGVHTAAGFKATAVEASATQDLPVYALGDDIGHDQPIAQLAAGDRVWVEGGRVYVEIQSDSVPEGKVFATRLAFGDRAPAGMIESLNDD
ncbi:MAG: hypothetical protein R3F62_12465 [Planctomycetota bacterium]